MPHSVTLISTIAAAFGLALLFGFIAVRLKMPALVGYLVAGVFLGPFTPGLTADLELTQQLAEIGVMLLMFGVGLHLSLDDLLSVRKIALPGALLQISVATALGYGVGIWWGWDPAAALVFGLSLSCASTVVLLRALESRGTLESLTGRIAVGWLVVEDVAMVVVLVLLPPLAAALGGTGVGAAAGAAVDPAAIGRTIALTLGGVVAFIVLMLVVGRRLFPWILWQVARTGSQELFTLCVIAAAVGIAYAAGKLFGVSFALGAFFAGMMLRESEFSHRAADESLPFRDAFAVLFFVSVGMLFDPSLLWREPTKILLVLAIIIIGKSLAAFGLVLLFRYPLNTALTVSASLAQIGEFSFILAGMGVALGLLPLEGQNLILAGAVVSIAINPIVFGAIEPAQRWILARSRLARFMERPGDRLAELPHSMEPAMLTGHVLIVGYGRVGRRIGTELRQRGIMVIVAEQNREMVERLRAEGIAAVSGDAADPAVLIQAHVARAKVLVIATPDPVAARAMLDTAQKLQPSIRTIVRTHSDDEAALLRQSLKDGEVFMGEEELANGMLRATIGKFGLVCVLLAALAARPAMAQGGDVRGVVRDEAGRPIPLAYVMALGTPEAILEPLMGTVTDSLGRYLIRGLAQGEVFLRVRRIGWRLSEPVRVTVTADGSTAADLTARATPIQLATVKVIASPPCLDKRTLHTEPQIQELWSSASDAVRSRAAIIESYAFTERRRFLTVRAGNRPDTTQNTDTTVAHDPTQRAAAVPSPRPSAARGSASQLFGSVQRTGLLRRGWRVTLRAPSDGILTSDEFLTDYCILAAVESDSTGDLLVRFRPIAEDPDAITVAGVVRLDAADGRMKRVDYDYRHDKRHAGNGSVVYGPVPIDGLEVSWVSRVEIHMVDFRRNVPFADFRLELAPSGFRRVRP